jgi:hypothetical protein
MGLETVDEGASVGSEKPEPDSAALGDLGFEVDDVVGGLGTPTVGRIAPTVSLASGLALGEVDAESEGDDLTAHPVGMIQNRQ